MSSLDFKKVKPIYRPFLNDANKEKRVKYCLDNLNNKFTNTLFTDEVLFELNDNRRLVWYRPHLEEKPKKYSKNPNFKVLVWGGICIHGKTELYIYRLDKKEVCNALSYITCLEQTLDKCKSLFGKNFKLMHDNARPHTAKITKEFLEQRNIKTLIHPPYSPDLNPIEKVWAFMKNMVSYENYETIEELIDRIQASWKFIKIEQIVNIIRHHCEKLPKIIELNGEYID